MSAIPTVPSPPSNGAKKPSPSNGAAWQNVEMKNAFTPRMNFRVGPNGKVSVGPNSQVRGGRKSRKRRGGANNNRAEGEQEGEREGEEENALLTSRVHFNVNNANQMGPSSLAVPANSNLPPNTPVLRRSYAIASNSPAPVQQLFQGEEEEGEAEEEASSSELLRGLNQPPRNNAVGGRRKSKKSHKKSHKKSRKSHKKSHKRSRKQKKSRRNH